LFDLSCWDQEGEGKWIGWKSLNPPTPLDAHFFPLLSNLRGETPLEKIIIDTQEWVQMVDPTLLN
jgi:hypothetical protein